MIAEKEPPAAMQGVAALLRETRASLGRDIAVAATTLRIRQPYLQAIEDGRFQDLPGATYAVGFVRAYAEHLGLDGNEIVRRFKQENSDIGSRAELVFPSATSSGGLPAGALIGIAIVGALIAYGGWYWLQERSDTPAEAVPPLPERLAALIHKPVGDTNDTVPAQPEGQGQAPAAETMPPAQTAQPPVAEPTPAPVAEAPPLVAEPAKPVETPRPAKTKIVKAEPPQAVTAEATGEASTLVATGEGPTPIAEAAPPPPTPKPVWRPSKRVQFHAQDTCWIKVRDSSGQVVLSRLLHKGDSFSPPDRPGLVMTVGNAGALSAVVDGREVPSFGAAGAVRHIQLDPDKLDSSAPPEPPVPAEGKSE